MRRCNLRIMSRSDKRLGVWATAVCLAVGLQTYGSARQTQEKNPPKDSMRVTVSGCVKGKALIVMPRPGAEPVSGPVERGRRLKLLGPKELINAIRAQKSHFVEVTGLAKTSQLSPASEGMPLGKGGRIRIGGGPPNRDPTQSDPLRDPQANEVILDTESWRPLPEACPPLD